VAAEEFDSSIDILKKQNIKILLLEERQDGNFRGRSIYFHDPDGNALELHDSQEIVEECTVPTGNVATTTT
jgi:regulator of RNase E activity RraB